MPERAEGSVHEGNGDLIIKFVNHWLLGVPDGWSIAFMHPLGYPDPPFTTLAGVVDCDLHALGHVHFTAVLAPEFEGTIPRCTPFVQCMPVRRETALDIGELTEAQRKTVYELQERVAADSSVYRKEFRR